MDNLAKARKQPKDGARSEGQRIVGNGSNGIMKTEASMKTAKEHSNCAFIEGG